MEIDNVNEILDATLEDRNGSNDIVDEITINNDKITETIVYNSYNYVRRRKCNENVPVCEKKKKRETYRRIASILRKSESTRTADDIKQLDAHSDIVRQVFKRRELHANSKERVLEKEDPPDVIESKAKKLAEVLSRAQHLVCYTGAGISTSALIPDYRGSQGIWTLLQQGKEIGQHDLTLAEPTFTHMALYELHRRKILHYTLSQNCDGLHLRSGLPRKSLSEIHGNMFIEVCTNCKSNIEYWRLFDTTELTARFNHRTNRRCHLCFRPLIDTIVHFGERGKLKWPLNWDGACKNSEKADVILCLGSSLKVLKKYPWLWAMDRAKNKRPKIYIVNLQWTPKDKSATIKINGKCDQVMKLVMEYMNIKVSTYNRLKDPIFAHATLLKPEEAHTVSQPMLKHHIDDESWKMSGNETTVSDPDKFKSNVIDDDEQMDIVMIKNEKKVDENKENGDGTEMLKEIKIEKDAADERKVMNEDQINVNQKLITENYIKIEQEQLNEIKNDHKDKQNSLSDINMKEKKEINGEMKSELDTNQEMIAFTGKIESQMNATKTEIMKQSLLVKEQSDKLPTQNSTNRQENSKNYLIKGNSIESSSIKDCKQISNVYRNNDGDDDDDEQEKIVDIQQRINQLLVIKQTNFLQSQSTILTDALAKVAASKEKSTMSMEGTSNESDYYKSLLKCYRAIEGVIPHWYDVNYAYSGLHSIIHPPPNEVDIWGSIIIPIFQLNRNLAECEFCFDNYAEDRCQFYRPSKEFQCVPKLRRGKYIYCECCDFSDDELPIEENENIVGSGDHIENQLNVIDTNNDLSNNQDNDIDNKRLKITDTDTVTPKIQPGWYGKGYRKNVRRRKRRQGQNAKDS